MSTTQAATIESIISTDDGTIPVSITMTYPDDKGAAALALLLQLAENQADFILQLLNEGGPDRSLLTLLEHMVPEFYEQNRHRFEEALRAKDAGLL